MENDEQTAVKMKQCNSCGRTLPAAEWFRPKSGTCSECESSLRRESRVRKSVSIHHQLDFEHKPQRDHMLQVIRLLSKACLATLQAAEGQIPYEEAERLCALALNRAMPLIGDGGE